MSGRGSTPTKPVPAARRGSKPKDTSASDKLYNFKTQFGNFMSGWISSENVFSPEKEKRYQSGPTYWKTNFSLSSRKENLSPQEFALRAEQRLETALRCFPKLEKNWTRQLTMNNYFDWKEWVNPLIHIHFFVIWLCKSLSVRTLTSWAQRDKTLHEKVTFMDTKKKMA